MILDLFLSCVQDDYFIIYLSGFLDVRMLQGTANDSKRVYEEVDFPATIRFRKNRFAFSLYKDGDSNDK